MAGFCIENAYICNVIADAAVLQKTGGGVLVIDEQREFDSAEHSAEHVLAKGYLYAATACKFRVHFIKCGQI